MVDDILHDRIEQYLLGNLPPDDCARLENEMAANQQLAEQVALQRLAITGIQRLAARDMRKKFELWDKETDGVSPQYPWLWATFILLGLLVFGIFLHYSKIRNKHEEHLRELEVIAARDSLIAVLQADYRNLSTALDSLSRNSISEKDSLLKNELLLLRNRLKQGDRVLRELERQRNAGKSQMAMRLAPPPPRLRGNNQFSDSPVDRAKKAYNEGKYDQAVQLFRKIPDSDPAQAQVIQHLPLALFYAGDFSDAIPAFVKLWEDDPENEAANAQGYLMLCYLAEGKKTEMRQLRMVIVGNPNHIFYDKAVALKDSI